jgi:dienelactone hydrolase
VIDMKRRKILTGAGALCLTGGQSGFKNPTALEFEVADGVTPAELRQNLARVLGEMPARPVRTFKTLESVKLDSGWRHKIEYLAEPADALFSTPADVIRAYLFVPDHKKGERLPAMIAIHQDGPQSHIGKSEPAGLVGDKNLFYGLELFQCGYVVICPDRFGHAERRRVSPNDLTSIDPERDDGLFNHRLGQLLLQGRTAFGKEAYDLMVTADILTSLDYVDTQHIGAIGHSAGGHNLVFFLFADPRVGLGVSSCGLFSVMNFFNDKARKKRIGGLALPALAKVGDSADYLAMIAPRPMLLTRGSWEWGQDPDEAPYSKAHVQETRDMEAHARKTYLRIGASDNLKVIYFDENGGNHDFPPHVREQSYKWIDQHLKATPAATELTHTFRRNPTS